MRKRTKAGALLGAAAMLSGLGMAAPAQAADPQAYLVLVEWQDYRPGYISDCDWGSACDRAEAYGTLAAHTTATGARASGTRFNFGKWEPSGDCHGVLSDNMGGTKWTWPSTSDDMKQYKAVKDCLKRVENGATYLFKDVMMCQSSSYRVCDRTSRQKNSNAALLKVYPGDRIRMGAHIRDYDALSSNDDLCNVQQFTETLTDGTLRNLDRQGRILERHPEAMCDLRYTLKTVMPVKG
ncbi:hypothetical protein [Streptomyces sp. NPDC005805]|uniref:hypothetical protein n=1 Tax=Streptomyces sp. NPDC005805 TaxID=3157068 RepID=UPI0033EF602D